MHLVVAAAIATFFVNEDSLIRKGAKYQSDDLVNL